MTPRQQSVLHFIEDYIARTGLSPTYDEIAAGVGLKSKNPAWRAVQALQHQRVLSVSTSGSRGINVLRGRARTLSDIVGAAVARFGVDAVQAEIIRQAGRGA